MSKELGRRENGKKENNVDRKKEKGSKNKMKRMLIMRFENMMRHKTISPIKYIPNCWKNFMDEIDYKYAFVPCIWIPCA